MRRPWFETIACVTGLGLIIQVKSAHAKFWDIDTVELLTTTSQLRRM